MRVGIVGGGFAGLAAAIAFRRTGHDVTVFEKTAGPSAAGGAISLAPNALSCLSVLGVRKHIETRPWSDAPATVRAADGRVLVRRTLAQLTGGEHATVPRSRLIAWLAAELPPHCVEYSQSVTAVSAAGEVDIGRTAHRFDLVVGADGARGVTRRTLWPDAPALRSTGITGWSWIVDRQLDAGFGPIWGRTTDFGILPLTDGRTYVYCGTRSRDADLRSFRDWPAPLPALIDAAAQGPLNALEIHEARPPRHLVLGRVVLIGDAAHTMRPTFGQGAALAMEDAITLAYRGTSALARRRPRMLALYGLSKAGSYFATPGAASLEGLRNRVLWLAPDPLFGVMAGAVSRWRPRWAGQL